MNSVKYEYPTNRKEYPKLMINTSGTVVLFLQANKGTVIFCEKSSVHGTGEFFFGWDMSRFEDFNGSITLES